MLLYLLYRWAVCGTVTLPLLPKLRRSLPAFFIGELYVGQWLRHCFLSYAVAFLLSFHSVNLSIMVASFTCITFLFRDCSLWKGLEACLTLLMCGTCYSASRIIMLYTFFLYWPLLRSIMINPESFSEGLTCISLIHIDEVNLILRRSFLIFLVYTWGSYQCTS